jgi:hypothetical protein
VKTMTVTPCPLCEYPGGFHDWSLHPFEVPAHLLKSGARLDGHRMEQVREDPILSEILDEYDKLIDEQFFDRLFGRLDRGHW